MEVDPNRSGDDPLATLQHRHRNQIQNMTSLVGLFGRRMPPGACREAFVDLRARFEALTFSSGDAAQAGSHVVLDLPELASRLIEALDPERRRSVALEGAPARVSAARADAISRVLGELVIALFRRGLADDAGAAEIAIREDGGVLVMRVAAKTGAADPAGAGDDLGWSIAEGLARNLSGALYRLSEAPLVMEARIPADALGR